MQFFQTMTLKSCILLNVYNVFEIQRAIRCIQLIIDMRLYDYILYCYLLIKHPLYICSDHFCFMITDTDIISHYFENGFGMIDYLHYFYDLLQ